MGEWLKVLVIAFREKNNMKNDKRQMETRFFFNGKSKYYYTRPDFDKRCFKFLSDELGLSKESVIAELGAGTGKFTATVASRCGKIFAVEPNDEMFEIGRALCRRKKNVEYVKATAEDTKLPQKSLDMALAVQSFHYFDKEKLLIELKRILKDGKFFCIIWNLNQPVGEFGKAWSALLNEQKLNLTGSGDNHNIPEERDVIYGRGGYSEKSFSRNVYMTYTRLKRYASSISFVPKETDPGYDEFYKKLKAIFVKNKHFGRVKINVTTFLQYGKLKKSSN